MSTVDMELTKWLATLGVGGILAAFIYTFSRKDSLRHENTVKQYTELWKAATQELITVVRENTASNTKLIALIETQERNSLRKSDIELMIRQARG